MQSKRFLASLGALTIVGTSLATLANADPVNNWNNASGTAPSMHKITSKQMGNKMHKMTDMKAIHAAILSGNFTAFQTAASSTSMSSLSQANFNLLTPQFVARKAADDQIKTILTNAGIKMPMTGRAI